jgi:tetratricopeptide (TPR) repeat protein
MQYAKMRKPPVPIPAEYTEWSLWRKRYDTFTAAIRTGRAKRVQNPAAFAGQLPRSLNSPVRLLDPSNRIVDFIGRVAELDDLLAWCNDDSVGRLRLIIGPGGIGKTRLALQLIRKLEEHWHCVLVGDRHEARILADIRAIHRGPVLLVVDYAETRIKLEELLRAAAADMGTIRVLLLARSAGQWWEQLAFGEGAIRDLVVMAGPEGTRLGEVLDEHVKDEQEVLRAVPVFAAALGVAPPDHVMVQTQAGRARILELHAAALVAVLKWIEDPKEEPLVRLEGILDDLLRHEGRFWQGSAHARGLTNGPNGMELPELRQVVAAGCLLGAANEEQAVTLLDRLPGISGTVKLARWLRELYPPDQGSTEWLGVMQPDRLAERLIVDELSRSEELTQACLTNLGDQQARRAILHLARAATENDIAERLLRRLLPLAAKVVENIDAPLETLVSVANAIPYPSMVLASAHEVITSMILKAPATKSHPVERARWLTIHGKTLTQQGHPEEALPFTQEAVSLYRELEAANPDRYQSELAYSLTYLGIGFSELGRPDEALQATQEAGRIYHKLAAANPGRYQHNLVVTLTDIGVQFSELGRLDEALRASQEAVSLCRELEAANPNRYQQDLAATLTNLGARWSELRCFSEALEVTQEAARLYERLAAANPDQYQPDFAATLANLGTRWSELGRAGEALEYTQKAVSLLQNLTKVNRGRYLPNFAGFLVSLSVQFLDMGRPAEALAAGQEALRVYRDLALAIPAAYRPNVAATQTHLGQVFSVLGRPHEALAAIQEAADLYRQLAVANSARFWPAFTHSLMSLGAKLSDLGRPAEALSAEQEAISLYHKLADVNPNRYRPELALLLMIVGARLSELGRHEAALSVEQEAISLYRQLADVNPDRYRPNLALALMIVGAQLSQTKRSAEALIPEWEAASLFRVQASVSPDWSLPKLAACLTSVGFRLAELGRPTEALTATREAVGLYRELAVAKTDQPTLASTLANIESGPEDVEAAADVDAANEEIPASRGETNLYRMLQQAKGLYRELAAANPEWERPDLALSLIGLGAKFSELGRPSEALAAVEEAVRLYSELAGADPIWYSPNLALAQTILGDRFSDLGRPADALSAVQEAVRLYRELAVAEPDRYRPILAASLNDLGLKFSDLDQPTEALTATREALSLYREQTAVSSGKHRPDRVDSGANPQPAPFDHDNAKALTAAKDAVHLYRALTAVNPTQYLPTLVRALVNLEARLSEAGHVAEARLVAQEATSLDQELTASDSYHAR